MARSTLQRVRFIVSWQTYSVGEEITPNGVLRDWLVSHGYVELVADAPAKRQVAKSPADREIKPGRTRAADAGLELDLPLGVRREA